MEVQRESAPEKLTSWWRSPIGGIVIELIMFPPLFLLYGTMNADHFGRAMQLWMTAMFVQGIAESVLKLLKRKDTLPTQAVLVALTALLFASLKGKGNVLMVAILVIPPIVGILIGWRIHLKYGLRATVRPPKDLAWLEKEKWAARTLGVQFLGMLGFIAGILFSQVYFQYVLQPMFHLWK